MEINGLLNVNENCIYTRGNRERLGGETRGKVEGKNREIAVDDKRNAEGEGKKGYTRA